MQTRKQRVFFDGNVCKELALRATIEHDLKAISRQFYIVVAPNVFAEMVNGLQLGRNEHLKRIQSQTHALIGNGKPRYLRLPREFALWQLLRIDKRNSLNGIKFAELTRSLLTASTKESLFRSRTELGHIATAIQTGWSKHGDLIAAVQKSDGSMPTAERWAELLAKDCGVELKTGQARTLADGLTAAYARISDLRRQYMNPSTKADRRRGDWLDALNLFYLCDPTVSFVTTESRIAGSVAATQQASQVILLRDFLSRVGLTV